ncbi:alpha-ribazole phosphatase [Vibrio vulnificus]|uniref:alpha-ribazole phosphatase n=1 Tax=Vibrio vulnificus TaxID=672 RepID=UPI000CD019F4|nr:alpha-ribazole phosphatase [Vibrio vulnificus]POF54384.1 alpha-ribazole phosphatase [Vibrio vulnificus]
MEVILLRHGKTAAKAGLFGRTDAKVPADRQQAIAEALFAQHDDVELIVSSPLSRCHELAELLGQQHHWPIQLQADLQEMDFGLLDGVPFDTQDYPWPLLNAFWQDPANASLPEGETLAEFQQRVVQCWSQIISTEHHKVLIITHGGVIRLILAHLLGVDWQSPHWYQNLAIENASLTHITIFTDSDQTQFPTVKMIGMPLSIREEQTNHPVD